MAKAPYKTKQMTEILTFLKSVQGRHVTVNEICDFFREKGISVGTTTIYRHLERMVKEGLAAKYVIDGSSSACFEYISRWERPAGPRRRAATRRPRRWTASRWSCRSP